MQQSEIVELLSNRDLQIINNKLQLLQKPENKSCYLNPKLVSNPRKILTCPKCFKKNLDHKHINARVHHHGRISSLPTLSKPSQNSISPLIVFGSTTHINNRTRNRHCTSFASDSPSVCATKILPEIEHSQSPQVTFIGTRE